MAQPITPLTPWVSEPTEADLADLDAALRVSNKQHRWTALFGGLMLLFGFVAWAGNHQVSEEAVRHILRLASYVCFGLGILTAVPFAASRGIPALAIRLARPA